MLSHGLIVRQRRLHARTDAPVAVPSECTAQGKACRHRQPPEHTLCSLLVDSLVISVGQHHLAHVLSLSGRTVNQKDAAAGAAKFAMCAACHGADGKGSVAHNLPFGAPNLTDNIWLYGGSQRAVEETLLNGRAGVMPAWKDILGEDKVHLLTAYVYSLSQDK